MSPERQRSCVAAELDICCSAWALFSRQQGLCDGMLCSGLGLVLIDAFDTIQMMFSCIEVEKHVPLVGWTALVGRTADEVSEMLDDSTPHKE